MRRVFTLLLATLAVLGLAQVVRDEVPSPGGDLRQFLARERPGWDAEHLQPKQAVVTVVGSGSSISVHVAASPLLSAETVGNALAALAGPGQRVECQEKAWWTEAGWQKRSKSQTLSLDLNPLRAALTNLSLDTIMVIGPSKHSTMIPSASTPIIVEPRSPLPNLTFETKAGDNDWFDFAIATAIPGFVAVFLTGLFLLSLNSQVSSPERRVTLIQWVRYPLLVALGVASLFAPKLSPGAERFWDVRPPDSIAPAAILFALFTVFGASIAWFLDRAEYSDRRRIPPPSRKRGHYAHLGPPAPYYFVLGPVLIAHELLVRPLEENAPLVVTALLNPAIGALVIWGLSFVWKPWVRSLGIIEFDPQWRPDLARAVEIIRANGSRIREVVVADMNEGSSIRPEYGDGILGIPRKTSRILESAEYDVAVTYAVLTTPVRAWTWSMGYLVIGIGLVCLGIAFALRREALAPYFSVLCLASLFLFSKIKGWLQLANSIRSVDHIVRNLGADPFASYVAKAKKRGDFEDFDPWATYVANRKEFWSDHRS